MTTFNIIMAIILIALSVTNAIIVRRYSRKFAETGRYAEELAEREKGLQKRHNDLDLWKSQLAGQTKLLSNTIHVYANKIIDDPDDNAPEKPIRSTYKQLASQLGYSVLNSFKDNIVKTHKDGKTRYSIDINIFPYYDK